MERWNNLLKVSQRLSDRAGIKKQSGPLTVHIKLILKKSFIMCSKFHPVKLNQFSLWRGKKIWPQCYHLIYTAIFQSFNWVLDQYAMKGSNETINKNVTRIVANEIQQCIIRIIHHNQVGLIPGMRDCPRIKNQLI